MIEDLPSIYLHPSRFIQKRMIHEICLSQGIVSEQSGTGLEAKTSWSILWLKLIGFVVRCGNCPKEIGRGGRRFHLSCPSGCEALFEELVGGE